MKIIEIIYHIIYGSLAFVLLVIASALSAWVFQGMYNTAKSCFRTNQYFEGVVIAICGVLLGIVPFLLALSLNIMVWS